MALLDVIKGVARRCAYPQPTTAFSSADPNIQLMIDCVQDAGDEAVERVDWQILKQQFPTVFTGDGVTAAFTLPVGFDRLSPSDTFISSAYPTLIMPGPVSETDLLRLKAVPMALYPSAWRQVQGMIEFYPILQLNEKVSFVYAQGSWITNSMGVPYTPPVWQADSDLALISERILRLGGAWRWKRRRGLDYIQEFDDFEGALDRIGGAEDTGLIINMSDDIDLGNTWPGVISDLTDQNY